LTGAYPDDKDKALNQDVLLGFGDGTSESNYTTSAHIMNAYALRGSASYVDLYAVVPLFFQDHPGKDVVKKTTIEERIPKLFDCLEKHLASRGTTYCDGNDLSVADFKLFAALTLFKTGMLQGLSTDIIDNYPHIAKLYQAIEKHEKVSSWLQKNKAK
jgi:glutathione S-transferase